MHPIAPNCAPLHPTAPHHTLLHPTAPYCTPLHPTLPHCTPLCPTTPHHTLLHPIAPHCTPLNPSHPIAPHCAPSHPIAPHCPPPHPIAPHRTPHPDPSFWGAPGHRDIAQGGARGLCPHHTKGNKGENPSFSPNGGRGLQRGTPRRAPTPLDPPPKKKKKPKGDPRTRGVSGAPMARRFFSHLLTQKKNVHFREGAFTPRPYKGGEKYPEKKSGFYPPGTRFLPVFSCQSVCAPPVSLLERNKGWVEP